MYFELQLSASVFTRIVRNRLKSIPLCIDREVLDSDGTRLVVDRVVVAESTWLQREKSIELVNNLPQPSDTATQLVWLFSPTNYTSITVPFLQVKQELTIHLVKSSDLDSNGANPTAPFKTLTIYPVFNVALTAANATQGGGPVSLTYTLSHVDFGLLYLGLSAPQRAEIEQVIAGVKLPPTTVDFGALTALLKRPVAAINAGIACDPAGSFVALRVDFDVYASPIAVGRAFFEAGPTDLLAGKEWAMFIDANVLTQDAQAKATTALGAAPKVKLESGPNVSWDPSGPALDISAAVELVDACPFFVDDIDMDVDVDIRVGFSVPTPNTLRTNYHLTGEPSDVGEEIACALTGALLWPFIGPLFLKDEDLGVGIGAYLGGLAVGPAFTFIGIIAAIETKGLSKDVSKSLGATCTKQDDEHYECNDVVSLDMSLSPPFNSRLEVESVYGVAAGLVINGTISNLRDPFMGSLEPVHVKPFTWEVLGACRGNRKNNFTIGNQAKISVYGTPPAGMCKAYILADPEGEFAFTVTENEVIITPRYKPSYVAAPYPCRVRVVTNRGVRTITLAPPAALTVAEKEVLDTALLRATASCFYWERRFTAIEKVRWLIDPPFGDRRFVHLWQIVVRGMQPQEKVRVEGLERRTLMTAMPTRKGVAHLALMFTGEEAPSELSLELSGGVRTEGEEGREMEISMQQVLFEHRASLPVRGPLRGMRFEGSSRARRLVIEDAEQDMLWDVRAPLTPALLRSTASFEAEARGLGGLVLQSGKHLGAAPSQNLRRALEQLRDRFGPLEAAGSPRVGGFAETLYVRTRHGASVFDVSSGEEPREIQVLERPAWYEGVALGGSLMARHDLASDVVEIYSASVRQKI
jgi:hypothetical protein